MQILADPDPQHRKKHKFLQNFVNCFALLSFFLIFCNNQTKKANVGSTRYTISVFLRTVNSNIFSFLNWFSMLILKIYHASTVIHCISHKSNVFL
jgi:hypothetical protein